MIEKASVSWNISLGLWPPRRSDGRAENLHRVLILREEEVKEMKHIGPREFLKLKPSIDHYDLVMIYCGPRSEWMYPGEILELCLKFAGIIGKGKRCSFFWIYQ